jgi:hypothetical protein
MYIILYKLNLLDYLDYTTNYSLLMLQFGSLVFVLSIVALAAPAYFGLYGAFILTVIPVFCT